MTPKAMFADARVRALAEADVAVLPERTANMHSLVDDGADVNATDPTHATPIMLAAGMGDWTRVTWLREHGADPSIPRRSGETVAYAFERSGSLWDAAGRDPDERTRQLLTTRGVRLPAEPPAVVRRWVFGASDPIDAGRRRATGDSRDAARAGLHG